MSREAKLTLQNQNCITQLDGKCLNENAVTIYTKLGFEANFN
jgi:hypothetical protein